MTPLSYKLMRYNFFVNAFVPYVTDPVRLIRYGLTPAQVTALTDFLTDWNLKFVDYVDPVDYSSVVINAINTAYQTGYTLTQSIRSQVKGNVTITLTSIEKAMFNIPTSSGSSHSGEVKFIPAVTCIDQSSMYMKLIGLNTSNPFKRGKPAGIEFFGLKTAITDAGAPPPNPEDYIRQENETTAEFEMLFTLSQVGKTLYIIPFYINTRNVGGKDGRPFIITII